MMKVETSPIFKFLDEPDQMGRPEKRVTPQDIEEFERSQAVALPADYKDYCLKYSSRTLQNRQIFTFKTKVRLLGGKTKNADVGAITAPRNMAETRKRYMDPIYGNSGPRLPEGLYPLTFDNADGHCLIDLNGSTHGRILYIVIKAKTFGDPGYDWKQVGTVAGNFTEFLAGLTPDFL